MAVVVVVVIAVTVVVVKFLLTHGAGMPSALTFNFLVTVMNTLNSSIEISELSFKNADVKSICYCKQRMKSKLSLFLRMCRNAAL